MGRALCAAGLAAMILFCAAAVMRGLRAMPAGVPALPWREVSPAELFGTGA